MEDPEIRLALALNGGVSLAVWMGGVADELVRFCAGAGPYGEALGGRRARVDVIGGASAGGLNGVFLALALVYGHEHLAPLRELWLDAGAFDRLFRSPYANPAPSLLRGDDYFLPELEKAVATLMGPAGSEPAPAAEVPIDLRLTVTSLSGERRAIPDDFGGVMADVTHDVELHFERGRTERDDFTAADAAGRRLAARRLARAARSSASFPGAFEASFATVCDRDGDGDGDGEGGLFVAGEHAQGFRHDRYLVDGGVLVNLPVNAVVEAIFDQPARGPVRRLLGTVVPDPSTPRDAEADLADQPPAIGAVVGASTVGIPRQQSVARFLDEVAEHNLGVGIHRAARDEVIRGADPLTLASFAAAVFPAYEAARREGSRAQFAQTLAREIGTCWPAGPAVSRQVAEAAFDRAVEAVPLPWVPPVPQAPPPLPGLPPALPATGWGASTIARVAGVLVGLLVRLQAQGVDVGRTKLAVHEARRAGERIRAGRASVGADVARGLAADHASATAAERAAALAEVPLSERLAAVLASWPGDAVDRARLDALVEQLGALAADTVALIPPGVEDPVLSAVRRDLAGAGGPPDRGACLQWLLAIEVTQNTFTGFADQVDQRVDLLQITSTRPAAVDPRGRAGAEEKLGGTELGHFGGFLKRSWRANDWMWGRLDAATFLGQVIERETGRPGADRAAQIAVLREELPVVAAQVSVDIDAGADPNSLGRSFRDRWDALVAARGGAAALSDGDLCDMLAACRVGDETVAAELGSDLASRTLTAALAAGTNTLVSAAPPGVRGAARVARAFALVGWAVAKTSGRGRVVGSAFAGTLFGVGLAGAAVDAFTAADLGPLAPAAWLVLLVGVVLSVGRAPLVAVPAIVVGVVPGLLSSLPRRPWGWWPDGLGWPRLGSAWVAAALFVLAALVIGGIRGFPPRRRAAVRAR